MVSALSTLRILLRCFKDDERVVAERLARAAEDHRAAAAQLLIAIQNLRASMPNKFPDVYVMTADEFADAFADSLQKPQELIELLDADILRREYWFHVNHLGLQPDAISADDYVAKNMAPLRETRISGRAVFNARREWRALTESADGLRSTIRTLKALS